MDPTQVLQALATLEDGAEADFNMDELFHSFPDPAVVDAVWFALDEHVIQFDTVGKMGSAVYDIAKDIPDDEAKVEWLVKHGGAEFYFFTGWMLYRAHKVDRAFDAAKCALQLKRDFPQAKLLFTIAHAEATDDDFPFTSHTFPPLQYDGQKVTAAIEVEGEIAFSEFEVSDLWTK